jgi:hypothetical protein
MTFSIPPTQVKTPKENTVTKCSLCISGNLICHNGITGQRKKRKSDRIVREALAVSNLWESRHVLLVIVESQSDCIGLRYFWGNNVYFSRWCVR